ncbi:hypothetical protein Tsubulata_044088, partial [Turnera subulata]
GRLDGGRAVGYGGADEFRVKQRQLSLKSQNLLWTVEIMEITMKRLILFVWAKLGSLFSSYESRSTHVGNGCANGDLDQVDLDLNLCRYHDCGILGPRDSDDLKFVDFVHQVLLLHQRSNIPCLHLSLRGLLHAIQARQLMPSDLRRHGEEVLKSEKDLADMCIHFAMRKEVKILVLDFVACYWRDPNIYQRGMYKVPKHMVGKKIIPKVRGREDGGSFKFVSNHLRIVIIYCWGMDYEDPAMDYELVRLVGFLLMAARKLEKIVISPTPTFNYKKIFRSLPAASPR